MGGDDAPEEIPDPEPIGRSQTCTQCGMIIANYPGPTGQVPYGGSLPEGEDGRTQFCSLDCLFAFDGERRRLGWEPLAYYVTDYSNVEYEINADLEISRHLAVETFADAETLRYVYRAGIQGAMEGTAVPFSEEEDADALAEEYDGSVTDWDGVSELYR
nr:nitrous oxide reductase accessory protein NosL [Natronomonas sp. LN261]